MLVGKEGAARNKIRVQGERIKRGDLALSLPRTHTFSSIKNTMYVGRGVLGYVLGLAPSMLGG